jgi:hypothetical protein
LQMQHASCTFSCSEPSIYSSTCLHTSTGLSFYAYSIFSDLLILIFTYLFISFHFLN